jgi:hypothetical protein
MAALLHCLALLASPFPVVLFSGESGRGIVLFLSAASKSGANLIQARLRLCSLSA